MTPTRLPVGYFRDVATVSTENVTTGLFSTVAQASLACRLNAVGRQAAATGRDRSDFAAIQELHSPPDYTFPAEAYQLVIDSRTWNPDRRTSKLVKYDDGTGLYWRTDLTEATT